MQAAIQLMMHAWLVVELLLIINILHCMLADMEKYGTHLFTRSNQQFDRMRGGANEALETNG